MTTKITADNITQTALNSFSSGINITSLTYPNGYTIGLPSGGQAFTLTGSNFASGIVVSINNRACTTTYINSTSVTFITNAVIEGTYNVYAYNTDGGYGLLPASIIFSSSPNWVTASGALPPAMGTSSNYTTTVVATGLIVTYSLYSGTLPPSLSLASTGIISGTVTNTGSYSFTIRATNTYGLYADRSFTIQVNSIPTTIQYLVIAGGGSGGGTIYGAGGGAGGYRSSVTSESSGGGAAAESAISISAGVTYTLTIGSGGTSVSGEELAGNTGNNSSITGTGLTTITSTGGGGGGPNSAAAKSGGSGGGSGQSTTPAGTGTTGQGYAGGIGTESNNYAAGGGGGAGAVGSTGSSVAGSGGNGGIGVQSSISGTATYYAGGGGGGYPPNPAFNGLGGNGGGGGRTTKNGTANTGGGGGAGYNNPDASGIGGSGVIFIRYSDSFTLAASTTGSPTIVTSGGYRIYKWTGNGSITF